MKFRWWIVALTLVIGGLKTTMALDIGETARPAAFTTLEGMPLTMDNYGDRRGTVVVFLSARCGAMEETIGRINSVHQKYRLREVLFVGVCSNPAETGEELRAFAQKRGCIFPVYRDPDGVVAHQFGARVTPEIFLLDDKGTVRYRGGIGPMNAPGTLDEAIGLMLAKRPIATPTTEAEGTPIAAPGPQREIDDPYGSVAFSSELVFERIPETAAHHCSTIAEAANGDLVCVWYGGSYESADDQVLFLSRRPKGDRRWTTPEVVVRNPGQPPGNAVVFRDGKGRLWIVWGRMESRRPIRRGSGWGQCRLMYRVSEDQGATWTEDREMADSFGWLPRNVPIILRSGELFLPLSGKVDGTPASFFLRTKDHGATWERSGVIPGGSQPAIIERQDGTLFAMMREEPKILQSESRDGGATWTSPLKSVLRNPDAGIAMRELQNGRVIIVFNDSSTSRTPLSVALSLDEGKTWEKPLALESNPGEYSYPSAIQTEDGMIHVTYTFRRYAIKHVEFNEAWLTHFERPN